MLDLYILLLLCTALTEVGSNLGMQYLAVECEKTPCGKS